MAWPAVVLVLGLALLLLPLSASACSCARETLAEQSARAALVVEAEVLATWPRVRTARTLLRVGHVRRGAWPRPLLVVEHALQGPSCGLRLVPGGRHVFTFPARRRPDGRPLRASLCRTWLASESLPPGS